MRFDDDADLDTSQIDDLRGSGGGPLGGRVALGGLGIVGLILYFVVSQLGGAGGGGPFLGTNRRVRTGATGPTSGSAC